VDYLKNYINLLIEKTAWKKHNINFDSLYDLKKWVNKGTYVTFTNVNKIGINPGFSYTNVFGIWGYPLNDVTYNEIISGTIRFAGDRPFIQIFKPKIPGAILNLDNLQNNDVNELLDELKDITGNELSNKILTINNPSEKLEKAIKFLSDRNPKKQSNLYQKLGYDGLLMPNKNLAVFFSKDKIKHLDMVYNPNPYK
jgi:hypothetical protein